MKTLCLLLLLTVTFTGVAVADIPPLPRGSFVLTNLDAFADCRFAYAIDRPAGMPAPPPLTGAPAKDMLPIKAGFVYRSSQSVRLFVKKGAGPFVVFAHLADLGEAVKHGITITEVTGEGPKVNVKFKWLQNGKARTAKSSEPLSALLPYFVLGAGSLALLVARRREW